jgi:hypothetical protein
MKREEKEAKEIRITLDGKRIVLAGLLAGVLFLACVAGSLTLVKLVETQPAQAEDFQAAFNPEKAWVFAEGYTGEGFEEWILLYNPGAEFGGSGLELTVRLDYSNNNGYIGYDLFALKSGRRISVNVNQALLNKGYSGDVSITAIAYSGSISNTKPIVAERALYFNYKGVWSGGSQALGYPVK